MREAKSKKLAEELTQAVINNDFPPGTILPSQHYMVKKYGLSRSCIQKAIDVLDERGLVERKPGKGIFVKRNSQDKIKKLESIIYILSSSMRMESDPLDNYGVSVLWGIEETARLHKTNLIIYRCPDCEINKIPEIIKNSKADGVIINKDIPDAILKTLPSAGICTVIAGRTSAIPGAGYVAPNYYDAYNHLFTNIKEAGIKTVTLFYMGTAFYAGDIYAVRENTKHNKGIDVNFMDFSCALNTDNTSINKGHLYRDLDQLISSGKMPELLCFTSDWTAIKTIEYLSRKGLRVPEDTKVIGALGLKLGEYCFPKLTTLSINSSDIGRKAVEILRKMVEDKSSPIADRVPFTYVERESFQMVSTDKS